MKKVRLFFLTFAISFLSVCLSCNSITESELQKKYKVDAYYFEGLKKLQAKDFSGAAEFFEKSAKDGSYYCSKNSYLNLLKIVDVQKRLYFASEMYLKFNDEESACVYAKELFNSREWTELLLLSDKYDVRKCNNELAYYFLKTFYKNQFSGFSEKLYQWWAERPISDFHIKFLNEHESLFDKNFFVVDSFCDEDEISFEKEIIAQFFPDDVKRLDFCDFVQFRASVYKRNYRRAHELFSLCWQNFPKTSQVYSDAGKTCLYASKSYLNNANFFKKEADSLVLSAFESEEQLNDKLFYLNFYAGRLYEKASYRTAAEKSYIAAMDVSPLPENFDNALWYLIYMSMQKSASQAVKYVTKWCSSWNDPDYFDDSLDLLSNLLLTERKFDEYIQVYKAIYPYASKEIGAQFAFISGKLMESGLVKNVSEKDISEAWVNSLNSGSQFYYKVMGAIKLDLSNEEIKSFLNSNDVLEIRNKKALNVVESESEMRIDNNQLKKSVNRTTAESRKSSNIKAINYVRKSENESLQNHEKDADIILEGYADFGLVDMIYPEWKILQSRNVMPSYEVSHLISDFLYKCAKEKNEFYPQSLRIIAKVASVFPNRLTNKDYMLLFPRGYYEIISKYAEKYSVPQEILFALVRSESFFDAGINSSAGAIGLAQLMKATAGDVGKKLKVKDYSLTDPETNVNFGAWYLADLYSRLEKNWLHSFFAYNSGKKRVSQWLSSANYYDSKSRRYTDDLFMEMIPLTETRGYGRKLIGAAGMYGFLYYGKSFLEVVSNLGNF